MTRHEHSPSFSHSRILAGDIGGTNSRLAVYGHQEGRLELIRQETYSSSEHQCLTEVLSRFLESAPQDIDAACLGLPAPITSGAVFPLTNLSWLVDRATVRQAIGTDRVALINDVVASAAAIDGLSDTDLVCMQPGQAEPEGNRVVVSVGTGLGVSALTPSGRIFATEAGHATFSPVCDIDHALQRELQIKFGHVSWERVASGAALQRIHSLLVPGQFELLEAAEIVGRFGTDPACDQAVRIFRRYIGAAAGNIGLTLMATGGLYLVGGVATKIFDENSAAEFIGAFCDKGRMRAVLERVPVFLVREDNLALRGAAQTAVDLFAGDVSEQQRHAAEHESYEYRDDDRPA